MIGRNTDQTGFFGRCRAKFDGAQDVGQQIGMFQQCRLGCRSGTAGKDLGGDAFTFVAPEEESELRQIEKVLNKRLPRVTVPDFDYRAKPDVALEVPLAERIAAIRARKSDERARAKEKAARRAAQPGAAPAAPTAPRGERPRASSARGRTTKGRRP